MDAIIYNKLTEFDQNTYFFTQNNISENLSTTFTPKNNQVGRRARIILAGGMKVNKDQNYINSFNTGSNFTQKILEIGGSGYHKVIFVELEKGDYTINFYGVVANTFDTFFSVTTIITPSNVLYSTSSSSTDRYYSYRTNGFIEVYNNYASRQNFNKVLTYSNNLIRSKVIGLQFVDIVPSGSSTFLGNAQKIIPSNDVLKLNPDNIGMLVESTDVIPFCDSAIIGNNGYFKGFGGTNQAGCVEIMVNP